MFGEEVKPDIDVQAIIDDLKLGYMTNVLCEGCGMAGIIKNDDGRVELAYFPKDDSATEMEIRPLADYLNRESTLDI